MQHKQSCFLGGVCLVENLKHCFMTVVASVVETASLLLLLLLLLCLMMLAASRW